MDGLTPAQRDSIGELINMGVGMAASSLSKMTHEEVLLSVPSVEVVDRRQATQYVEERVSNRLTAVRERFTGGFAGDAWLLFPEKKSLELVRTLLSDDVPLDMMTELEQGALVEVGNIILNACLGTFADSLKIEMATELPEFFEGSSAEFFSTNKPEDVEEDVVLFISIDFTLQGQDIGGYVTFVLGLNSLNRLTAHVDAYLAGIGCPG
jgi:chemotaxis protein CheC